MLSVFHDVYTSNNGHTFSPSIGYFYSFSKNLLQTFVWGESEQVMRQQVKFYYIWIINNVGFIISIAGTPDVCRPVLVTWLNWLRGIYGVTGLYEKIKKKQSY